MANPKERLRRVLMGSMYAGAGFGVAAAIHAAEQGLTGWGLVFGFMAIMSAFIASGSHKS